MDPSQDPERRMSGLQKSPPNYLERETDMVNHPPHYNDRTYKDEPIEAIEIIELFIQNEKNSVIAYNMSNVVKYLLRFRKKGTDFQDVKKAKWYLERMLYHLAHEESDLKNGPWNLSD